ncbi:MAG: PAS domain S-box protein [Ignavibacteriaceae bacterium]|nr:PAS domain S-box protein [Ignavibacteriaceae bacterium]
MKSKLIIVFTVIILTGTIFLLVGLHNSAKKEVVQRFQSRQLFTARQLSKELESCLRDESLAVEILSSLPALQNKKIDAVVDVVQEYFEYLKKDHVKSINIHDEKGTIIYSTLRDAVSFDHSDTKFFAWAVQRKNKGELFITAEVPFMFSKSSKNSTFQVMIVAPIYGESTPVVSSSINPLHKEFSDKFVGIVSVTVDLDEILTSFFRADSSHKSKQDAWLLDKDGTVLYQAEHPEMIMFNVHQQDESCLECHDSFKYVESILSQTTGSTEYQLKESPQKLSSFVTLNFRNISWKVVVNTPLDEITDFVDKNSNQTLALIAVISLILIGFSFSLSRSTRLKAKDEIDAEKLRGQQAFNLILESAGEGIFGLDLNGNHTFINPMAAKLLGYKIEELIGKHSHTLWHHTRPNGDPYPGKDCHIYATLHEGVSHSGEEFFWRKDGSGFQVDFSTTPILESGKVVGAVVTFRDITKRKFAEEALRASEERFRSVTQSANDAIIIANRVGTILGWNKGAEKIFGFADAEIIGKSLELIVPLDYRKKHHTGIERLGSESERHIIGKTMELQGLHKSGNVIPVELSLSEWKTSNETFYTGIIRDISEGKKAEEEQEKQREILEKLYDLSGLLAEDMTLEQSLEKGLQIILSTSFLRLEQIGGLFLAENGKKELVLKCSINLPEALQTMCAHVPFGHCLCGRAASSGKIQFADCVDEKHDNLYPGIIAHGHYNIPIFSDGEVVGVIVVYLPVGHISNPLEVSFLQSAADVFSAVIIRKHAENEIKSKNQQLQKTNSEKDKFFSIIAHDLKSPFNGLLGLTEIMASEDEDISKDELLDYSKSLHKSASSVYKLLENLLEWAQIQKGSITFSPEELNISTEVTQNIEILNQRALQKGITIINEVDETQKVYADEKMINTVLRNFLSNAVKFTKQDGKIIVRTKKLDDKMIEVSVQDTGVGMAEKDVIRLFKMEESRLVGTQGTEGEPSTGLGLLLCKEFVEKNGGKVWAESTKGEGSIFYFTVPECNNKNI